MRELTIRTRGPAICVIFELEGPTRLLLPLADLDNTERIGEWLSASPARAAAILAAIAAASERDGDERGVAWHRLLGGADREPE
jgi:hypothetical protein